MFYSLDQTMYYVCYAPSMGVPAGLPAFDNKPSVNRGPVLHYYYCFTILFLLIINRFNHFYQGNILFHKAPNLY